MPSVVLESSLSSEGKNFLNLLFDASHRVGEQSLGYGQRMRSAACQEACRRKGITIYVKYRRKVYGILYLGWCNGCGTGSCKVLLLWSASAPFDGDSLAVYV